MLLALILAASPVTEATKDYADLDYEGCVGLLTTAHLGAKERAAGELLLGLCHFALGHEAVARTQVEAALRRDPSLPVPAAAGPRERVLIESLRVSVKASAKRPPVAVHAPEAKPVEAARPATPDVAPPPPPPLIVASDAPVADAPVQLTPAKPAAVSEVTTSAAVVVPKPWWPYLVGGVAVAAAGTAVGFGLAARNQEQAANAEPVQVTASALGHQAGRDATVANVAIAVAGTAAVAAVIGWIATQ